MTNGQNKPPAFTSGPWLLGIGLIVLGLLTLVLYLGWLRQLELLAIAGGLVVLAGLFALYAWANPGQNWAYWAGYIVFNVAAFFGVGYMLDFRLSHYIAWGAFLIGLPFLGTYIRQVWRLGHTGWWWTIIPAGGLITAAAAIIQLRVGWPDHLVSGILITTFMGGIFVTLFVLWYPNRAVENFGWVIGPLILTGLLAALGGLLTIDMAFLAVPAVILFFGGYFLVRYVVLQWAQQPKAAPPRPLPPPSPPPTPAHLAPTRQAVPLPSRTLTVDDVSEPPPATIQLSSPAFDHNFAIPKIHTCDGANSSPELRWRTLPAGTQSIALICDDPDAPVGIWTHWVVFNLEAAAQGLSAGVPNGPSTPAGGQQGMNDFRQMGYGGPCPPPGDTHRYYFKIYALSQMLPLQAGASKRDVMGAMDGRILAMGQLVGTYRR